MTTEYRGILFDKDGTLFSFAETWSGWARSFLDEISAGDPRRAEMLGALVGYDYAGQRFLPDSIIVAAPMDEIADALLPALPDHDHGALLGLMSKYADAATLVEATPLMPLLENLAGRGLKLGVATNDSEQGARAHLSQGGVLEYFDYVVGFDSGFGGKPGPGMLSAFAQQHDLLPRNVVMVGDSTHDLIAGRAAGMATVAVLTGIAGHRELSPHADHILPDIGHLPNWLDAMV